MKLLVADDGALDRLFVSTMLREWGHDPVVTEDAETAWRILETVAGPWVAILDWQMPGNEELELCQRIRTLPSTQLVHVILLTGRARKEDVLEGLLAGADDYITKPFDRDELRVRLQVGQRMLRLQEKLCAQVRELGEALARVRQLQGLLPICCYCKRVRDDGNYWQQVEHYIAAHSELQFSHGICPTCFEKEVEPQIRAAHRQRDEALPQ
jgi:DNA-binding response OmpR family regulator